MSLGQILVLVVTLLLSVGAILMGVFKKRIPKKICEAIVASFVSLFSAVSATIFFRNIGTLNTDLESLCFVIILSAILVAASWLLVYLVKDDEKRRKIFFTVSLVIFLSCFVKHTFDLFARTGVYPSHLCRQIAYGFPVVYFCKERIRKYLLPYFVYAGIIGGFLTLCQPGNIFPTSKPAIDWGEVDRVISHVCLFVVPVFNLSFKEVKPNFHHIWQFTVLLGASALFAHFSNYMNFVFKGTWGNGMYLTEQVLPGFDWWWFGISCIALTSVIILLFNVKTMNNFFKNRKKNKKNKTETTE